MVVACRGDYGVRKCGRVERRRLVGLRYKYNVYQRFVLGLTRKEGTAWQVPQAGRAILLLGRWAGWPLMGHGLNLIIGYHG